jgi:hypothetical protein
MKQTSSRTNKLLFLPLLLTGLLFLFHPVLSQEYIAGYTVAKEAVLRRIPTEYINKARSNFVIAYQHTSHGTHVSRGLYGLPDYKEGDKQLFAVSNSPSPGMLEIRDNDMEDYAPEGVDGRDISKADGAILQITRSYLDAPENADVNVLMWAWCNIIKLDVKRIYLDPMTSLISEYGEGGTKIGTGKGQRELPVIFIFMTGHALKNYNHKPLLAKDQAAKINAYCSTNSYYCLDYYSIDSHTMDDIYYEDSGDDSDSESYGGNFNLDWQNAHTLGEDYYENRFAPGRKAVPGSHNTQHITSNRKAYAMWWILARLAGWDGNIQ